MKVRTVTTLEQQGQKAELTDEEWFVAGVGMVQQIVRFGPQTMMENRLKSYQLK